MTQQPQAKHRHDYHTPDYQVTDTDLTSDLDAEKTVVTAVSQAVRHGASDVPLHLNGEDLALVSIRVDDEPWTEYKEGEGTLVINQLPERFMLRVVNEVSPAANTALEGLYQSSEVLCTQRRARGFRHITWYLNRPGVLVHFTTKVIADRTQYPFLLSSDNRVAQGELENSRHWVQQQDPSSKLYCLFALVADDFDVLRGTFITRSGREVALELYVDRGNLDHTPWAMTSLKNSMRWSEEHFGLEYDFDAYMIVAVDFFNMGVIENKGLDIFNSKYMLTRTGTTTDKDYLDIEHVIGHEYFHNWTGNRVTYRDWFRLSLEEGLAVFRDQEFSFDLGSHTVNRISNVYTMRGLQFAEDANPMAHPIRPDMVIEMDSFYTLTVYEKGAEIIHMIHILLGEANFQKRVQLCFERYDGSATTYDDFVQAMEGASNVDFSRLRRWYSRPDTPILTVRGDCNPSTKQYTLTISQRTPATPDQAEKQPLHIPFALELYNDEGRMIPLQKGRYPVNSVLNVTQAEQTFVFDNVYFQPVPTLLCKFSAPVKPEYK